MEYIFKLKDRSIFVYKKISDTEKQFWWRIGLTAISTIYFGNMKITKTDFDNAKLENNILHFRGKIISLQNLVDVTVRNAEPEMNDE
jgi:hypothetical protein